MNNTFINVTATTTGLAATTTTAAVLRTVPPEIANSHAMLVAGVVGVLLFIGLWVLGLMLVFGFPRCQCLKREPTQFGDLYLGGEGEEEESRTSKCVAMLRRTLMWRVTAYIALLAYAKCCFRCARGSGRWIDKMDAAFRDAEKGLDNELQRLYTEEEEEEEGADAVEMVDLESTEGGFVVLQMEEDEDVAVETEEERPPPPPLKKGKKAD